MIDFTKGTIKEVVSNSCNKEGGNKFAKNYRVGGWKDIDTVDYYEAIPFLNQ